MLWECKECFDFFDGRAKAHLHRSRTEHKVKPVSLKIYKCPLCDSKVKNEKCTNEACQAFFGYSSRLIDDVKKESSGVAFSIGGIGRRYSDGL